MKTPFMKAAALAGVLLLPSCVTNHDIQQAYCSIDEKTLSAEIHDAASNKTLYSMTNGAAAEKSVFVGGLKVKPANDTADSLRVHTDTKVCLVGNRRDELGHFSPVSSINIYKIK
jgi:hypothetical protein